MHSSLIYFCCYCLSAPLVIGLTLLVILIGELTCYICNARLLTLQFFIQLLLFQGTGHRGYLALCIHISRLKIWISSTSLLHTDKVLRDLNLLHLGLGGSKTLHPGELQASFSYVSLICRAHEFLMKTSARNSFTEKEEWKYQKCTFVFNPNYIFLALMRTHLVLSIFQVSVL